MRGTFVVRRLVDLSNSIHSGSKNLFDEIRYSYR
jgi:hypothetical protein